MGPGCPDVRDGGRVPPLLRGPAYPNLRKNRLRQGKAHTIQGGQRVAIPPSTHPTFPHISKFVILGSLEGFGVF